MTQLGGEHHTMGGTAHHSLVAGCQSVHFVGREDKACCRCETQPLTLHFASVHAQRACMQVVSLSQTLQLLCRALCASMFIAASLSTCILQGSIIACLLLWFQQPVAGGLFLSRVYMHHDATGVVKQDSQLTHRLLPDPQQHCCLWGDTTGIPQGDSAA